jgi:Rrf2 family transcriptional regulator, iron-sulfur cluster assembly transcription factor
LLYSKASEYALRALTHLAGRMPEGFTLLRQITDAEEIPYAFLSKIFHELVQAKLLRSAKGPGGGYALARPASSISLYEIKDAVEGTVDLERCAVGLDHCTDGMPCPQHDVWKKLRQEIKHYLQQTTLADMERAVREKRALLARERRQARGGKARDQKNRRRRRE